ncbi:MAG: hypothetical protein IPK87_12695 [Planctomycetes bacterium]|nr:hypothetical protein [Planctomycetota bacterium]
MRSLFLLGVIVLSAAALSGAVGGAPSLTLLQKKGEPQEVIVYHKGTKNIHQRYQVVNGKANGKFEQFRADGKTLESEGTMKDGQREGEWKYYHPNGKLQSEGTCVAGKKHGWWKAYNTSGEVTLEAEYAEDKESGMRRVWKDGELQSEGRMEDGVKEGYWIEHKSIGNEGYRSEGTYLKGKKHGEWKEFRSKEYFKGEYILDVKEGKWTYHTMDDKEIGFETWAKGKQHGPTRMMYPRTEKLWYEGEYENGRQRGTWVRYHATGHKESELNYVTGFEVGPQKRWYPDGTLQEEYTADGRGGKTGVWTRNYSDGTLLAEWIYDSKGELVSMRELQLGGKLRREYDAKTRTEKRYDDDGNLTYLQIGDEATEYYPGGGDKPKQKWVVKGSKVERTDFYESGALKGKGPVDQARKRDGEWVEYYENGNKSAEGKYKGESKVGKWVEYHENGKKAADGEYITERETYDAQGKVIPAKPIRIGKWNFYDDKGKRTHTENFPDPRKG